MIKIEFLDEFIIKEKDIKNNSLETLLSIDCRLKIIVDENLYYEDWVCPLEMYYHYRIWKNKCKPNNFIDFKYITEDNNLNPILEFTYVNKNAWKIDSCFKKYNEEKRITTEDVINFFSNYEKLLYKHIN